MENKTYQNIRAVSLDINRINELSIQLKIMADNPNNINTDNLINYENEYATRKFNIIFWLNNEENYDIFKNSSEAKGALLFKQIKSGLFENEIGLNYSLKDKIIRDYTNIFNNTEEKDLLSSQEIKISKENLLKYEKYNEYILSIYDKEKCYQNKINYLLKFAPENNLLDKNSNNLFSVVKTFPHFLRDNPYHFIVNMGTYKNKAPTVKEFFNLLEESSMGLEDSKEKILYYTKMFNDFLDKIPNKESINNIREKSINNNINKTYKVNSGINI